MEDWHEGRDILQCNPDFHGQPRFDCIVINTSPISFGQLQAIFKCHGKDKKEVVVALVKVLRPSKWKPQTLWEGCWVFEEKGKQFVLSKYLVRGCHMIPAWEKSGTIFYLTNLVDNDALILGLARGSCSYLMQLLEVRAIPHLGTLHKLFPHVRKGQIQL